MESGEGRGGDRGGDMYPVGQHESKRPYVILCLRVSGQRTMAEDMLAVNSEAIERLQMGRDDEALALYRTVPVRTRIDPEPADASTRHGARNEAMFVMWSVNMDEFMDDVPPTATSPNDELAALYYKRPFKVHVNESEAVGDDSVCETRIPIILSYNVGLTCHRIAVKHTREASYREALDCYLWSYRALREQLVANGYQIDMDLVQLALLLNTSHCYEMLDDSELASVWWDRWHALWRTTPQKRHLSREERAFYQAQRTRGRTRTHPSFNAVL